MPSRNRFLYLAVLASLLALGCAGTPPPDAEMARARTLISQAESSGAQRYAAADIDRARSKLAEAQAALSSKDFDVARMRADEAAADAELAAARARSSDAQRAAEEMQRSVDMLRQEAERGLPRSQP
jgi:hypothetical protein